VIDTDEFAHLRRDILYLKDRQEILDCIVREARGRDRHDVELTRSAYWDDAYDEHGANVTPAPEYPAKANAGHAAFFSATQHNLANHTCEIAGDVAYCETYVVGTLLTKDQQTTIIAPGRYIDQMERRNGEWRIAARRCTVEMSAQGKTHFLHSAAVKGFLKGQWSRDDVSYQRPVELNPNDARW
jgi:hypothetical protein